jgi:folate-binding protein YgfZ
MAAATDLLTDTARLGAEYAALTERCGLIDRSERGKLALSGPDAKTFLAGQVTNDVEALQPGAGCYAAFLTHKGKMLGDLRILDVVGSAGSVEGESPGGDTSEDSGEHPAEELLLDTERVALQALFDMIRRFKVGYTVDLHKRTIECDLFSLIGPHSRAVITLALDHDQNDGPVRPQGLELPETEHSHREDHIAGRPVRIVSTDVWGIDVLCAASDRDAVWNALLDNGAHTVSEQAAEIVRVERGRPRYGVDMDASTIPQEAGLNERVVSFTKGCYVGQETVARLHYKGKPNRQLRGLRLSAPAPPGLELHLGEKPVGRLSSAVLSPTFGPIGLGLIRREAQIGASVSVGDGQVSATVLDLPFGA